MGNFPFNVRVYFLLFHHEGNHVLVSNELIRGNQIVKFPGGGLEFGEGTLDCARREAREELGIELGTIRHVYTTDFFIPSAFNPKDQVISIYYATEARDTMDSAWISDTGATHHCIETGERFYWKNVKEMEPDFMTFVGDREMVRRLKAGL
jgi:8-oxo-dGTP diphosphatase